MGAQGGHKNDVLKKISKKMKAGTSSKTKHTKKDEAPKPQVESPCMVGKRKKLSSDPKEPKDANEEFKSLVKNFERSKKRKINDESIIEPKDDEREIVAGPLQDKITVRKKNKKQTGTASQQETEPNTEPNNGIKIDCDTIKSNTEQSSVEPKMDAEASNINIEDIDKGTTAINVLSDYDTEPNVEMIDITSTSNIDVDTEIALLPDLENSQKKPGFFDAY